MGVTLSACRGLPALPMAIFLGLVSVMGYEKSAVLARFFRDG
jgi:hypothetical protein